MRRASVPVAASPGDDCARVLEISFLLAAWDPSRMRGSAGPSQPHGELYLSHFGLSTMGAAGTPGCLPGQWTGRLWPLGERCFHWDKGVRH